MAYKIIEKLLTPNKYSRPQDKLIGVRGIVIHWVANVGSSALANRNYFENRKYGKTGYGSAHYIIDLDGDVIRCIPENEMAYHVGSKTYTKEALSRLSTYPNNCTIGIECCHVDWNGKMTDATYNTLVELAADLLKKYKLTADDLWLHKEVVGWKNCHKWFVDNPDEWVKFKELVREKMKDKSPNIEKPKEDSNKNGDCYTIQSGDTLWKISQKYNMTVDQLLKLNPNVKPETLQVGQKIKIKSSSQNDNKLKSQPKQDSKPNSKPKQTPKPKIQLTINRTLRYGNSGNDVKQLQEALNKLNFKCGIPDGIFGAKTKDAVMRFQKVYLPYEVDGIVGKRTLAKINELLK
jgi:N-acetylmuramoyl-L-alanine amidase